MIKDGFNGFLVPPRDVNALTNKLRLLLVNDQLRKAYGTAAIQTVQNSFTKDLMVEKTRRGLEEIGTN
jgi:glycosyltransferase involved in cell wall biosynthesis